jgi:hypothetical protein
MRKIARKSSVISIFWRSSGILKSVTIFSMVNNLPDDMESGHNSQLSGASPMRTPLFPRDLGQSYNA